MENNLNVSQNDTIIQISEPNIHSLHDLRIITNVIRDTNQPCLRPAMVEDSVKIYRDPHVNQN